MRVQIIKENDALVQEIKQRDPRLYEALRKPDWVDIPDSALSVQKDRVVFGLGIGAAQPVGDAPSVRTPIFPVRQAGTLLEVEATSGDPGTGSIAINIKRSRDRGTSWVSVIVAAGIPLTAGDPVPHIYAKSGLFVGGALNKLEIGDYLYAYLLAGSSVDWKQINIKLRWL